MPDELVIKPLQTLADLEEMQQLEVETWGNEPIPTHQTLTVTKNGGIVLGGYMGNRMVGFVYSFPGFNGSTVYLCSHMLAIHPHFRGRSFGKELKLAQRKAALSSGYKLMTWTFDPLESVNSGLNIAGLGAVCRTYIEDCYGNAKGNLNNGLATDRFMAEWWLGSPHVSGHLSGKQIKIKDSVSLLAVKENGQGFPEIESIDKERVNTLMNKSVLVPIPLDFQKMQRENKQLAVEWRLKTRKLFQKLFANGYIIAGIKKEEEQAVQNYIFVKQAEVNIEID